MVVEFKVIVEGEGLVSVTTTLQFEGDSAQIIGAFKRRVKVKVSPPDKAEDVVGEILIFPEALAVVMPIKICERSNTNKVTALRGFFML
jgi:hypothetical protein